MTSEENKELETQDEVDGMDVQSRPQPYMHEPLYKELLDKYSKADWQGCAALIDQLLERYPEDPNLLEFQREVNMRQLLQSGNQKIEEEEKRAETRKLAVRAGIALAVLVVVFFAARWGINSYRDNLAQAQLEREMANQAKLLAGYYENAENYMRSGRFTSALELYQKIYEIDPEYDEVADRIAEAEEMIALDERYQEGVELFDSGDIDEALAIFEEVEREVGHYKNTSLLITRINNIQEVERLFEEAKQAYEDEDWATVVANYETIIAINSAADVSEIEEQLYMSYINLIFETADKPDASIEDVEKAEEYYRKALSLFPQNRDFVEERQELERVAKNLLSNKYYLHAIDLINTAGYSVDLLEEALRNLNKAKSLGNTSPAVESEISVTTLYLDAFDDFVNKRWEDAITNLEQLYRIEEDYANGIVKFLLYEAYTARGDTLYTFADYANARVDYEDAAKFAYGDSGNALMLFQIEVRIAYALRRIASSTSIQEAAAYFDHAANLVNFAAKAAGNPDLVSTLNSAQFAYNSNDFWNAVRLYEIALEDTEVIYDLQTIQANSGDSIAHIAFFYGSTVEAIREFNQLGDSMVIRVDSELVVPVLVEDQE